MSGGVGGSKFIRGLSSLVNNTCLTVIGNTGDDMQLWGLHISPDLDTIMYTMANIQNKENGWGIDFDSFNCLEMMKKIGGESWFRLGDQDLAVHLFRTEAIINGFSLSKITEELCQRLGVKINLLPMSDGPAATVVCTEEHGDMHFEEYLVKYQASLKISGLRYMKINEKFPYSPSLIQSSYGFSNTNKSNFCAFHNDLESQIYLPSPGPKVLESIKKAKLLLIAPSNPLVSIKPILGLQGVRDSLYDTTAIKIGVSPLVGGKAIKGPADFMLSQLGMQSNSIGVARLYSDFLDGFVIDDEDSFLKKEIEEMGIRVHICNTIMRNQCDEIKLAQEILDFAEGIR